MKNNLSIAEQSHFNARLDLGRIDAAKSHCHETQNENYKTSNAYCEGIIWVLYIKNKFRESLEGHLRQMPFYAEEYEVLYKLLHEHIYRNLVVVFEDEVGGKLEKTCEDFVVAIMQRNSKAHYTSYASSGRNFFQFSFKDEDPIYNVGYRFHECDKYPLLYRRVTSEEYNDNVSPDNRKIEFALRPGQSFECPHCGLVVKHTNVEVEDIFSKHDLKFNIGGG